MSFQIQMFPSSQIDKLRWDECIAADPEALLYSTSWFLDGMAEEWWGLIIGDYKAEMPLPVKRKAGLKMDGMPPFAQRLGIAGKIPSEAEPLVLKKIFSFSKVFQYAASEIFFQTEISFHRRTNFILPLRNSYEQIAHHYTKSCRKNISKSENRGCVFINEVAPEKVFRFYKDAYGSLAGYTEKHYQMLENLLNNPEKNILC